MQQTRVVVLNEVRRGKPKGWQLCFQRCRYAYGSDDGGAEDEGYRFIWRREDGSLQGARGQARIPSVADALELLGAAVRAGWAHYQGPQDHAGGED